MPTVCGHACMYMRTHPRTSQLHSTHKWTHTFSAVLFQQNKLYWCAKGWSSLFGITEQLNNPSLWERLQIMNGRHLFDSGTLWNCPCPQQIGVAWCSWCCCCVLNYPLSNYCMRLALMNNSPSVSQLLLDTNWLLKLSLDKRYIVHLHHICNYSAGP